jgi:hypothetical protein
MRIDLCLNARFLGRITGNSSKSEVGPLEAHTRQPYGLMGRVISRFCAKKSNGRITNSCHITGQSSARAT